MQPQPNQKSIIIRLLAVVVVLLLIVAGYAVYKDSQFREIGSSPALGNMNIYTSSVSLDFSRQLSGSGASVSISPNILKSSVESGKSLTLQLKFPSTQDQTYTITIHSIAAADGSKLHNLTLSFKPKYATISDLPKPQQKQIVSNQDKNQGPSQDPIMQYLPHNTIDYALTGLISEQGTKSVLTLQATLYISEAGMSDEQTAIAQEKQEVISYIQSLGLNPANYTIDYTVSTP